MNSCVFVCAPSRNGANFGQRFPSTVIERTLRWRVNPSTQSLPGIDSVVRQCGNFRFCRFPELSQLLEAFKP